MNELLCVYLAKDFRTSIRAGRVQNTKQLIWVMSAVSMNRLQFVWIEANPKEGTRSSINSKKFED